MTPAATLRALLIDDDTRLAELLTAYLQQNDVAVTSAGDAPQGLAALSSSPFDVVLLDVMLPGMSGLEACRRIRQKSQVPLIMLTAKGDETDRVVGLELGADDYVSKPFSPRELLARIRAVVRRAQPDALSERIIVGDLVLELGSRTATLRARSIELTGLEFDLLAVLARRAGRVISRELLLTEAGRGDVTVSDRTVDVHISHLRQKLGDDPRSPLRIRTVRGLGYMLSRELP